jgi:hypothetical protein
MKGESRKRKRKCQVVESSSEGNSTSSAKSSGSARAPNPDGGAASVIAGDSDVVNLSGLHDEALVARILKKAPALLGFNAAGYDTKFFEDVVGLCGISPNVSDVPASDDKKLAWKSFFPPKVGDSQVSRVWLRNDVDSEIIEYLSTLWTAVYGQKPDNGSISYEFYRAAMYSKGGNPTKWAKHAAAVYRRRISNAARNSWKLQPPCLLKQLQGLVDEVAAAMEHIRGNKSPTPGPFAIVLGKPSLAQRTMTPVLAAEITAHDAQAAVQHTVAAARRNLSIAKSIASRAQDLVRSIQSSHV